MTPSVPPITPAAPKAGDLHILWRCFTYLRSYKATTVAAYVSLLLITGMILFSLGLLADLIVRTSRHGHR